LLTLLFVYFGKSLPKFLFDNLARTRKLFPSARVVLVSDAAIQQSQDLGILHIHPDDLDWPKSRPTLTKDMRFWNGWWQKTFDRLLVISPIHDIYPEGPLLQVEADNILFPSFPIEVLKKKQMLAFPLYSETEGVASVIFSPTPEVSKALEAQIIRTLEENPNQTDMLILGEIAKSEVIPTFILPEFSSDSNFAGPTLGLFDGLSHGDWICGRDPRAHWGIGKRRLRTPKSMSLEMPKYEFINGNLFVQSDDGGIPIHNLHIHSKEGYFFEFLHSDYHEKTLGKVNNLSEKRITFFDLSGFLFCLSSNVRIWASSFFSINAWIRLVARLRAKVTHSHNKSRV
jgi:hypothetical protein